MKKIYSIAFAAVALFSAASCQKEMADPSLSNGGDFTITATTVADTKTVLDDDANVIYWTPGDKISVFDADNKEVKFSTSIMEQSTTAKFTNDTEFNAPVSLVAAYPYRGAYAFDGTVLQNFRVAGSQTAVAGSFDPEYAGAIGLPKEEGSSQLVFSNIHCLVKFTIGGEEAPTSVKLACNCPRYIAGLYHYNLTTGVITQGGGASEITLNGTFKAGETYYIVVIPGEVENGLSLYFNGIEVKNTAETITLLPNKIYNLGTVEVPETVEEASVTMNATLVASRQSEGTVSWLTSLDGGAANMDRNATSDGEFVYIANVNTTTPAIYAIEIADPSNVNMVNMTGVSGGYFPISCARTIKNGYKYILIASGMGMNTGEKVNIYAWENGIDAAPTILCSSWTIPDWAPRRFGDFFNVCGDWSKGELWFRSQTSATTARYNIVNGVLQNPGSPDGFGSIATSYVGTGSHYRYSMTDNELLYICNGGSNHAGFYNLSTNGGLVADVTSSHKFSRGFRPFEYDGKKFIAYVSLPSLGATTAKLVVLEDKSGSFSSTLVSNLVVFEADINANGNTCTIGNGNGANCEVITVDDKTYIFAHAQNLGYVVYEISSITAK